MFFFGYSKTLHPVKIFDFKNWVQIFVHCAHGSLTFFCLPNIPIYDSSLAFLFTYFATDMRKVRKKRNTKYDKASAVMRWIKQKNQLGVWGGAISPLPTGSRGGVPKRFEILTSQRDKEKQFTHYSYEQKSMLSK